MLAAWEHLLDIRGACRGVVMEDERDAVAAQLHVDFDEFGTGLAAGFDGGKRVFRSYSGSSPVADE